MILHLNYLENKKMKLEVYYKSVYGNDLCYPQCLKAKKFAKLANQKTLSKYSLELIASLGYKIDVVAYNPNSKTEY